MARRVHNQPLRDDFVIYPDLGLATVRVDHLDGSSTFSVQVAVRDLDGLHLATDLTITAAGSVFTVNAPGHTCEHPTLVAALAAALDHLPCTFTAPVAA